MFYKTIPLNKETLARFEQTNARQQDLILFYYLVNKHMSIGPSTVERDFRKMGFNWPITSIRRAITNLTDEDYLEKTDNLSEGAYGKPEHLWRYNMLIRPVQGKLF